MLRFRFAKLVRDKIVAHQIASGATPVYYQLEGEDYVAAVTAKIGEEAQEIAAASPKERAEEIADVQQLIDDLRAYLKITPEAVKAAQAAKNAKNGAFRERYFIESVTLGEHDRWVQYYREHPDRYPELP